jgi:bacterioferritin-associated ferredoxin
VYICLCRAVSLRSIRKAIAGGATTVAQVGERCRAGTVCQRCQPLIQELIDEQTAKEESWTQAHG